MYYISYIYTRTKTVFFFDGLDYFKHLVSSIGYFRFLFTLTMFKKSSQCCFWLFLVLQTRGENIKGTFKTDKAMVLNKNIKRQTT